MTYLEALHALGADRIEDLGSLDHHSIESLDIKKLHKVYFLEACRKAAGA